MNGLMTGHKDKAQGKIAFSLMVVVQNALSHAWQILLQEVEKGQFSICESHEDEITEKLYMILCEVQARDPEVVKGLSGFETPAREANLRNYRGDKLDCQPDLTFRPPRARITTSNTAITGIFVECKPIDSQHSIGSTYCKAGISRFICGDYAWAVDRAMMLGYVRNICHLPDGLSFVLSQPKAKTDYQVKALPTMAGRASAGEEVYYSQHGRCMPGMYLVGKAPSITLHHLWLYPEQPCENSKCKV